MSKFHPLAIARIDRETRDAVAITFAVPDDLAEQYRFLPGQHLTLRTTVDGADVRRSYSICSAPQDGVLRIAVKRCPGGLFSTFANERLGVGDTLEVMPPLGHFGTATEPGAARHHVAFAAGSGITPVLSIAKATLAAEPRSQFTLFYGNRASASVMFREELAALKDVYLDRFSLVHVLSRETQDIELLHGRIDAARAESLLRHWAPLEDVDVVYLCGPDAMMQAVKGLLESRGVAPAKIRIERFASSIPRHEHKPAALPQGGTAETEVTVILDGARRTFTLDRTKDSILEAGLAHGVELPYSCKGGVCATCRCRVVEGEVDMDANFALEDYEVARGFVLACQSYPASDRVTVDFDQTGTG
jgi:ring-1,2-phenylacetyl-CoA epoxidase subunit PaaE